jgi:methionine sulfoxide reductase heme-binding subunit
MSSIDLWYTTRATGLVALVLLSATIVLGILTAGRAPSRLPAFARADIHRRLAVLTVVFLAIHVLTSVLDTYVDINWLAVVVPFTSNYHTGWLALGTVGVDFFLAVALSSALRRHISARAWRLWHWAAYLSWPVAVAHGLGMGTDARLPWVLGLVAVCIAGVVGAVAWRVARSVRSKVDVPATIISPRNSLRLSAARSGSPVVNSPVVNSPVVNSPVVKGTP